MRIYKASQTQHFLIEVYFILLSFLIGQSQGQFVFACDVPNCSVCTFTNFCGLCSPGYTLQLYLNSMNPVCVAVSCNINNCLRCIYPGLCQTCQPGYYPQVSGGCSSSGSSSCGPNCMICLSTSSTQACQQCVYGYVLGINGICVPTYSTQPLNCQIALYSSICQLCLLSYSYALSPTYGCVYYQASATCNITNCQYCNDNNTCQGCESGYQLENLTNQCVLLSCAQSIPYCIYCQNSSVCSQCQTGYILNNSNTQCVYQSLGCTIPNCIICGQVPNQCTICQKGYFRQKIILTATVICLPPSQLSVINTIPTNCLQYVSSSPYIGIQTQTEAYTMVLCIKCMTNFIMVGGRCLPLINQNAYPCNVSNCNYCTFPNYCGLCNQGYYVLKNSGGLCVKLFSPVPNCLVTAGNPNQFNYSLPCLACKPGYIVYEGLCYQYKTNITCNVSGCSYCLTNNSCSSCLIGFTIVISPVSNLSTCLPICQIQNCYLCLAASTCSICNQNYTLSPNFQQCMQPTMPSNCSVYGSQCLNCNSSQCINCQVGFSVVYGICCQNIVQNIYGCMSYLNPCTLTCTQCLPGFLLSQTFNKQLSFVSAFDTQCISFPCSIPNCQYCFRSSVCVVCKIGYLLQDTTSTCINNQKYANCSTILNPYCTQCTNSSCNQCAIGYILINNQCYCSIPNCLQCMGSAYCYKCASPFVPSPTSGQCVPPPTQMSVCQVPFCSQCNGVFKCSICAAGYSINYNNTCSQNICPSSMSCQLCDSNLFVCYSCKTGYTKDQLYGNKCIPVPAQYSCFVLNCAFCSLTNSNQCTQCVHPFQLNQTSGQCQKMQCITNCQFCLYPSECIVCDVGFYLNTQNLCQSIQNPEQAPLNCSIPFCLVCDTSASLPAATCKACLSGYQLDQTLNQCQIVDCQASNCVFCTTPPNTFTQLCLQCSPGFFLNSYMQCVAYQIQTSISPICSVPNCIYCAYNNSCSLCISGFYINNSICVSTLVCQTPNCYLCQTISQCLQCLAPYTVTQYGCSYNCSIANCVFCPNATTCTVCAGNYSIVQNGSQSLCECTNNYAIVKGTCQCAPNNSFNLGRCISCNIQYCGQCISNNRCISCQTNMILNRKNNTCACPAPLTVFVNGTCFCPTGQVTYNNLTCLTCNIQFCQTCIANNVCGNCSNGYSLVNGTACVCEFPQVVQYINNQSICVCQNGGFVYNGTCLQCNIPYCTLCSAPNQCVSCVSGYQPSPSGSVCSTCNITNCVNCLYSGYCTSCTSSSGQPLVPNASGQTCILCNIQNCFQCSYTNECLICMPGYAMSFGPNTSNCVICTNVPGCFGCSANNYCFQCLPGYNVVLGQCLPCAYPCKTCIAGSSTACQTCQEPFNYLANDNGTCSTCKIQNCILCSSTNSSQCSSCNIGYIINLNNTCSPACQANCYSCSSTGVCLSCSIRYVLVSGTCTLCFQAPSCTYCLQSNISQCIQCTHSFYLGADNQCHPCPQYCTLCANSTFCNKLKTQTQLFFAPINANVSLMACDSTCLTCVETLPAFCIHCNGAGYFKVLANGTCMPCKGNCRICLQQSPSTCIACFSFAYLVNGQCIQCQPNANCLVCSQTNTSHCLICPFGYTLNYNNVCTQQCGINCLSCLNSTFCTYCQQGYSLSISGQCLPCLSSCMNCPQNYNYLCLSCGSGYYKNQTYGCIQCPKNCLICNQLRCFTCMGGYLLTSSFTCSLICQIPCVTCLIDEPSKCTSCLGGYNFNNLTYQCQPILTCSSACNSCPFGYSLQSNNTCLPCLVSNCDRCSVSNQCGVCQKGYYLNSNLTCSVCPTGCFQCTSGSLCSLCSAGYTSPLQPVVSNKVTCVKCTYPCQTCYKIPYICVSCVEGFIFQGWKCISSFNFGFSVSLNTNLQNFQSEYGYFLTAIANSLSANIDIITVNQIKQNGLSGNQLQSAKMAISQYQLTVVSIKGNITLVSTPDSKISTVEYYQLLHALTPGTTIANMQIINSSVIVNGGTLKHHVPTLPVVIGICVPLIIIVLIIVIFIIYSRRKNRRNNQNIPDTVRSNRESELKQVTLLPLENEKNKQFYSIQNQRL